MIISTKIYIVEIARPIRLNDWAGECTFITLFFQWYNEKCIINIYSTRKTVNGYRNDLPLDTKSGIINVKN